MMNLGVRAPTLSKGRLRQSARSFRTLQQHRLATAKQIAGPRYTEPLNVNLPISSIFEGLGRTPAFFANLRGIHGKIHRAYSRCSSIRSVECARPQYQALDDAMREVFRFFKALARIGDKEIRFVELSKHVDASIEAIWGCIAEFRRASPKDRAKSDASVDNEQPYESETFSTERHYLFQLRSALDDLAQLAKSPDAAVANMPALLLGGVAGTGKTHLFCDVAQRRIRGNLPTFIFLGEEFTSRSPWDVILGLLGFKGGSVKLLEALNEYGRRRRVRTLLMVDALNEASTSVKWGALHKATRYKYVAVAVSIRSGFERQVLSAPALQGFVRVEHRGFESVEWVAVSRFFTVFNVPLPQVPLLAPEFQNPLFLRLFCHSLQRRQRDRKREAFRGHEGSTYVFEHFVKNAADSIAKEFGLRVGRDKRGQYVIWDTVIDHLADRMVRRRGIASRLPERVILAVLQEAHPSVDPGLLLRSLERHLLVTRVPKYSSRFEVLGYEYRFSFQKFSDHLIVRHLLKRHLRDAKRSFRGGSKLGNIVLKPRNRGLIEALAVQVPERLKGNDLVSVAPPGFKSSALGAETFIDSLVWRAPHAFNVPSAIAYINQTVIRTVAMHRRFLDALVTVATIPQHPFNADRLHQHISRFAMPKRDAWWLPFLQDQYGANQAVDRLVSWAWQGGDKSHVADDAMELAGIVLVWFFASSNRFLRDRSTKALVALLTDRLDVVQRLIERFSDVNDPYVAERLYGTAYGCALRSQRHPSLGHLAQLVYDTVFANGRPPAQILLRDYARGVIEIALYRGHQLKIDKAFRPPYLSTWPTRVPSKDALKSKYYERHEQCRNIWFSVIGDGDFDRYVIQPNIGHFSSRRLGKAYAPSTKERYEGFVETLAGTQRELWDNIRSLQLGALLGSIKIDANSDNHRKVDAKQQLERQPLALEEAFLSSLSVDQAKIYKEVVRPYESRGHRNEYRFNIDFACRWIYQRVFTLGWTPELFGDFDSHAIGTAGREDHKAERVGKKYQWIALHELLARAADNFQFRDDAWSSTEVKYDGPWQLSARDIDPSSTVRQDGSGDDGVDCWWMRVAYDGWASRLKDEQWLRRASDLPSVRRLIKVKDRTATEFTTLEGFFHWEDAVPPEQEKYERERRELWIMLKSYLVKRAYSENFYRWATGQTFSGRWMPESNDFYTVFLREFPWAPAFNSIYSPYHSREEWTDGGRYGDRRLPVEVLVTADEYLKEGNTFDCSVDSSIHVKLPAKWIYDRMGLEPTVRDGIFTDAKGELVALDPSVEGGGPGVVLIKRQALDALLAKEDCDIIWTVLGEKQLIGGNIGHERWLGRLEVSGAYRFSDRGRLEGVVNAKFRGPDDEQSR